MLIEEHEINLVRLSPIDWEIKVKTPSGISFVGKIQSHHLNEAAAFNIFKQNYRQFVIDLDKDSCSTVIQT